ncbi:MAG: SBBP repeat-containing protein [candidate division WOR-3 bacterium]|nr:MAG: SBBP repeat-containing protein [candidate division WOR-3 bacterium]
MCKSIHWLCVVFNIILPIFCLAQEWVARYNGPGNAYDAASAIALDNAGNIYVTGPSCGLGPWEDYATVKYDSLGAEQWVARYNGPFNYADIAMAIALDTAGNVYVTGQSDGSGTWEDYATLRYNASGVEQWVARYNGPGNDYDAAYAITVDNAGNVYVTGQSDASYTCDTSEDYATVRYDSMGVEQWVARYNGPGNSSDLAMALVLDAAGSIYVTGGSTGSGTGFDYATVKYDASGVEQWVVRYNGPGNGTDWASAIVLDAAGNTYITGRSEDSGTGYDYATVKYDASGVEMWVVRYNGPGNGTDWASAIALDAAGNAYITGGSEGSGTDYDYATVKYDASGVEQWVARYNGPGSGWDLANAIAVDAGGNVYVTGYSVGSGTSEDYTTIKYDSLGVEQWVMRYDAGLGDFANDLTIDGEGNVFVTGRSWGTSNNDDFATVKYSLTGIQEDTATAVQKAYPCATIFRGCLPLPEDKKCRVFNIAGRLVEPDKIQPGIYFIEIDGVVTQKVVKVR